MIKIRLGRHGRTKRPFYHIIAAESRQARDGRFLEKLGTYDPNSPKELDGVNVDAIRNWISKGAELSDTVKSLFKKHRIQLS